MDPVSLPISVIISIASCLVTVGIVYGVMRAQVSKVQDELKEMREKLAATGRDLNIEEKERIKLEGQVNVLRSNDDQHRDAVDELKATVVKQDVFLTRMTEQDKTLRRIDQRLDAGARTLSQQMPARPRADTPSSDPPDSGLPPMRPRLPSRRGTDR